MFWFRLVPFTLLFLLQPAVFSDGLKMEPDEENVVASRIEGDWQPHNLLTQRLSSESSPSHKKLTFKADPSVVRKLPEKLVDVFRDQKMKIYLAGHALFDPSKGSFLLTQLNGNPSLWFWLENGDVESVNVFLAVAKDKNNDLLFLGGDSHNGPFEVYERMGQKGDKSNN